MNPDDLIMKYIDGELSYSEDEKLRKIISLEPKVKEDFELDIYIHSAIIEDSASISPSSELVNSTEDRILMNILASQKNVESKTTLISRSFAYVAAIIVFIVINFIYFGDNSINYKERLSHLKEQMNLYTPLIIADDYAINNQKSDRQIISEKFRNNYKTIARTQNFSSLNSAIAENISEAGRNQNLNILENIENQYNSTLFDDFESRQNQNIIEIDMAQIFNSPKEELMIDRSTAKPMLNLHGTLLNLFQPSTDFYTQHSDIQFSSFFGTDIYRNGIPDKKIGISHVSQAIAYSINNSQRIGIELGYTEYSYEQTVKVLVPLSSINDEKYIITQFNNDNDNDLILYPIKFNKNQQVFWGAAFYEESLLSNQYLSLVGRIGGGTTSDGPLGYTRFFAKINVMNNLSLSIGSEGRLFLCRVPELNSEKSWKSSVSLIYGFQFKF